MQNEVFNLKGNWRLCFNGIVPMITWRDKGAAQAQLSLLNSGYSVLQKDGTITHVGAKLRKLLKTTVIKLR